MALVIAQAGCGTVNGLSLEPTSQHVSFLRLCSSPSFFGNVTPLAAVAPSRAHLVPTSLGVVCKESRIGRAPITIPKGVSVKLDGSRSLLVKGPLGQLQREYPTEVALEQKDDVITVARALETRRAREMHGLFRTLTNNMIVGVSQGFQKKLILIGVGYRAAVDKAELVLNLGFFNPVRMAIPEGITCKVEENTRVTITGYDKVAVGDFAANVRAWRKPEPYKGKGIRYEGENVRRKEGKVGKKK
eukprot:TRINITY_DN3375_c0_g1_i1.p1 TRINITY_DN3375_c0_g1~~TRINITY_DN3375_c0_g1_i1.p1  ORF type:complete len:245 (-),score=48.97 TRINITY_DN3375_c0_g1_i1:964-1698(-)